MRITKQLCTAVRLNNNVKQRSKLGFCFDTYPYKSIKTIKILYKYDSSVLQSLICPFIVNDFTCSFHTSICSPMYIPFQFMYASSRFIFIATKHRPAPLFTTASRREGSSECVSVFPFRASTTPYPPTGTILARIIIVPEWVPCSRLLNDLISTRAAAAAIGLHRTNVGRTSTYSPKGSRGEDVARTERTHYVSVQREEVEEKQSKTLSKSRSPILCNRTDD